MFLQLGAAVVTALIRQACWALTCTLLATVVRFAAASVVTACCLRTWKNDANLFSPSPCCILTWACCASVNTGASYDEVHSCRWQTTMLLKNIFFLYAINCKHPVLFYFLINHQSNSGNSAIFTPTFSPRLFFFARGICVEMMSHGMSHVSSGRSGH